MCFITVITSCVGQTVQIVSCAFAVCIQYEPRSLRVVLFCFHIYCTFFILFMDTYKNHAIFGRTKYIFIKAVVLCANDSQFN